MGLLIAGLVLAPLVAAAGALDWRARRRRRSHPRADDHRVRSRDLEAGLDIGDIDD